MIQKPWLTSFGPLPAAHAGRIPVEPAFSDRIRRAATRFYIDEMAAIREETDEGLARERQARLDETMNAAVEARRTGVLSPVAARLLEACDVLFSEMPSPGRSVARTEGDKSRDDRNRADAALVTVGRDRHPHSISATERKSAAEQTSGGDRRPLPEVALSTRRECGVGSNAVPEGCGARTCAGSTKGGDHDLDASGLPLTTPVGKLLQLRPGQDVAVFGDVAFDSRRRA